MPQTLHHSKNKTSKKSPFIFFKCSKLFQKILKISVSNFCFSIYTGLYICLPAFQKKYQIQNWIKFTFAKSQLKFWGFSIRAMGGYAKIPKFQPRFCEGKCYPILDLIFFWKGRETYREPYVNWKTKIWNWNFWEFFDFFENFQKIQMNFSKFWFLNGGMFAAWWDNPNKPNMS